MRSRSMRTQRRRPLFFSLPLAALTGALLLTTARFANAAEESPAAAPPPPRFGQAGQLVLPDLVGLSTVGRITVGPLSFMHSTGTRSVDGSDSPLLTESTMFSFAPSADVVVFHHLTVGATISVTNYHWKQDGPFGDGTRGTAESGGDRFSVSAMPRVGYIFALTPELSLWPRAGAGLSRSIVGDSTNGGYAFLASMDLALVYQPTRALLLSVGPELAYTSVDAVVEKAKFVSAGGFAHAGLVF
jgi:hypothetical protein